MVALVTQPSDSYRWKRTSTALLPSAWRGARLPATVTRLPVRAHVAGADNATRGVTVIVPVALGVNGAEGFTTTRRYDRLVGTHGIEYVPSGIVTEDATWRHAPDDQRWR